MNKRKILSAALLLSGLAGCASGDPEVRALYSVLGRDAQGSAEVWLDRGRKEYAANRCGLAIRYFRNALNNEPSSVLAMNGMAACYDKLKRFDLSERFYRAALAQNPGSVQTLNNLGYSYYLQDKPDLAVGYLQEAKRRTAQNQLIKNNVRMAEKALVKTETTSNNLNKVAYEIPALSEQQSLQSASTNKVRMVRTGKSRVSLLTRKENLEWQAAVLQQPVPRQRREESPVATVSVPRKGIVEKVIKTSASLTKRNDPKPIKVAIKVSLDEYLLSASATTSKSGTIRDIPQPIKTVLRVSPEPVSTTKRADRDEATEVSKVLREFSIEVSNGTGRRRMAARMSDYLAKKRQKVRWLTNAESFNNLTSTIFYKSGAKDAAARLASTIPVPLRFLKRENQRAALQLELGGDLLNFDKKLIQTDNYETKVSENVDS